MAVGRYERRVSRVDFRSFSFIYRLGVAVERIKW